MRPYAMLVFGGLTLIPLANTDALAQAWAQTANVQQQNRNPWDPPAPPKVQLSNPYSTETKFVTPDRTTSSRTYRYQMNVDSASKKAPPKR